MDKPITAVATHIHWDHIGGHQYFQDFYAHAEELDWLRGGFPQPLETIKTYVTDRCDLPEEFDINAYRFFQGTPTKVLHDGETINKSGRCIEVLHTPGPHVILGMERGYLFTGDLVYKDTLFAYDPSADPETHLRSLKIVAALPVKRVFPAHHSLEIHSKILIRMRDALQQLKTEGKLNGRKAAPWQRYF